jgi:peptidoglycan hydrolase-like protein with peptidoglycan-binding domain
MNDPLHRPTTPSRSTGRPANAASTRSPGERPARHPHVRHDRRALLVTMVAAAVVCGLIGLAQRNSGDNTASASSIVPDGTAAVVPAVDAGASGDVIGVATTLPTAATSPATAGAPLDGAVTTTIAADAAPPGGDLDGGEDTTSDACTLDKMSIRQGDTGAAVTCLQEALVTAGFYSGAVTGQFDQATFAAVESLQTEKALFVDGVVGRETAISLGIWPDEEALVVRTPIPPAGAMDLMGYPLSSVAVSGNDPNMPPLPEGSGSGKRLVYDRAGQRVWAVDKNERVIRSWLVSGSKYGNELPGTHQVYSRSEQSTAWNGKAILPKMVRWLQTRIGHIGFHGIPRHVEDNSRYQTDAELGTRLSGGCQRQADIDAAFVWDFAQIGTTVVVL